MKITEALKSLENSWSRDEILVKIKNGEDSEKIVNDFCSSKQKEIETLTNFINPVSYTHLTLPTKRIV